MRRVRQARLVGQRAAPGLVLQATWPDDACSPMLVAHKGRCDDVLTKAIEARGGMTGWEDVDDWTRQLAGNVQLPGGAPALGVPDGDNGTFLRRHPRRIDLRRTADVLDAVRSIA